MTTQNDAIKTTKAFWDSFYSTSNLRHDPSPFACWCSDRYLTSSSRILELGCGNGRDSFTFAKNGHQILAVDGSEEAIKENKKYSLGHQFTHDPEFLHLDFNNFEDQDLIRWTQHVDFVYSRFVLHAIPEELERKLLTNISKHVPKGAIMLHEYRTPNDPLMQKGEAISQYERMTDHYRRFIDPVCQRPFIESLGWTLLEMVESRGLAVFNDEDPCVARVVYKKQ